MISTYGLPESIASPQGGGAVYTCSGEGSGAYAQCDGGICFRSTEDTTFPGFDKPVRKGQIICSCPITQAKPGEDAQGYQILGPYPCDKSFFGTAKLPPPPARRVRRSMSVLRLARLRVWRSSSTARSRPSMSVGSKPDKKLLHLYATWRMPAYTYRATSGGNRAEAYTRRLSEFTFSESDRMLRSPSCGRSSRRTVCTIRQSSSPARSGVQRYAARCQTAPGGSDQACPSGQV